MRKILLKIFNKSEDSELVLCGPSTKNGTYAIIANCPKCGYDITVVLTTEDILKLYYELDRVKNTIEKKENKMVLKETTGEWMWDLYLECPYCNEPIVNAKELIEGEEYKGKMECPHCNKKFYAEIYSKG